MITTEEIKAALEVGLGAEIGTYTFSGGQTTPAIRIDDGAQPYPEEPTVEGLEVVIQESLEIPVKMMLGGYQQTFSHRIVLKQWDIEKTCLSYLDAVMEATGQFSSLLVGDVRRVMRSTVLDNIETLTIMVSESVLSED